MKAPSWFWNKAIPSRVHCLHIHTAVACRETDPWRIFKLPVLGVGDGGAKKKGTTMGRRNAEFVSSERG